MPDRRFKQVTGFILGFFLLPLFTHAQSDKLYRVEMLVFSNPGGSGAEQWEATPALAYPARSRMLVGPGQLPEETAPQRNPTPFVTLPHSELAFRGAAARIQRDGRYRTLFHEAWTQAIPSRSSAIPIVLDHSGDGGPWPPLQGSVRLYIARYIYLETNLWLNTSGEYLHSNWRMPAPPLGPSTYAHTGFPAKIKPPPTPTSEVETSGLSVEPAGEWSGPEYPYGHAVLLNETRRMRSGEVNYIDHPMFGMVIKVTPVQRDAEGESAG